MSERPAAQAEARPRLGGRTGRVTEQIPDATVELIARHGVAGVSYDAIADVAGTSRATIHGRWRECDDLLLAARWG